MSRTPYQVQDLAATDQLLTPYVVLPYRTATTTVGTPATGVFHSTIIGRGKMVDLSNDLSVRMGIERIQVQSVMRIDGETGPAGEAVFKPVNDKYDQIRFVGGWSNQNDSSAPRAQSTVIGDFCEITFYGTGLNILCYSDATNRAMTISVDGGATVSIANQGSGILTSRNYAPNSIINLVSGLTLGLHTVKISSVVTTLFIAYGFEILNTASTLQIAAGTALVNGTAASLSAATTSAYNSGFESGTLGTRGGRVLVYMKNDGTIGKAVTPTDAASLTLTSTNHANEEVIRSYFWREFGAGRTDDFSTLTTSASARAFTLDDGTTTLATSSAVANLSPIEAVSPRTAGFITFTFVGTGLDLLRYDDTNGGADTYEFRLDGTLIQTQTAGNTATRITKIVSGLPYGTHTLRIDRVSAVTWNPYIANFIVYGPKKPTIPAGAMELADYNVMADYVANATAGLQTIATGVLRKATALREAVCSGTWAMDGNVASYMSGAQIYSNVTGNYYEYTFFGTGFELRGLASVAYSTNATLSIDGNANWASFSSSAYGGYAIISSTTGQISYAVSNTSGSGLKVSGLALGKHTLRVTAVNAQYITTEALDIITPIHTHKNNGPFVLQNTLSVGSSGINDSRKFGSQLVTQKYWAKAIPVSVPASTTSTTHTTSSITLPIYSGGSFEVGYSCGILPATNTFAGFALFIDGVQVSNPKGIYYSTGQIATTIADVVQVALGPGQHELVLMWRVNGGVGSIPLDVNSVPSIWAKEL